MDYNKVYKKYYKISLWLIAALYLIGMLVVQCVMRSSYIHMLTISAVFSLLYGFHLWWKLGKQSPYSLLLFWVNFILQHLLYACF